MAMMTPRKRKLVDYSEPTLTVLIGSTMKSFTIHPTILTNHSRFFRGMLDSHAFKEAFEKVARLPEVEPDIFQVYVTYIYSGKIRLRQTVSGEEYTDANDPEGVMRFQMLIKLYALANYLQDPGLQNAIIDQLFDTNPDIRAGAAQKSIVLAFATTPAESALCRVLIDTHLSCCDPAVLERCWDDLPEVYLKALTLGWARASFDKEAAIKPPARLPRCYYHVHDEEVGVDEAGSCGLLGSVKAAPVKKRGGKVGAVKRQKGSMNTELLELA